MHSCCRIIGIWIFVCRNGLEKEHKICYNAYNMLSCLCETMLLISMPQLSPFASPQPDSLPVLLQLRYEPISLLDHVRVLLVLIVRSVSFYDFVDTVDGAGYAVSGDELC